MRRNFLLAFSLLAMPLLLLMVIINAFIVTPLTMRHSLELEQKTLALYRAGIDERLAYFDKLSKIIMQDKRHIERLNRNYASILDVTLEYITNINEYADIYRSLNENLAIVRFYVDNDSLNKDYLSVSSLSQLRKKDNVYETLLSKPSGGYIFLSDNEVYLYRVLNYIRSNERDDPVLEFVIRKNELQRAVGGSQADLSVLLTDTEGNVMVLSGSAETADIVRPVMGLMTDPAGTISIDDDIVIYDTTATGWRIIKLVTPSASFAEAMSTRTLINILALLSGGITIVLIIVFSNSFSIRMRLLTNKILAVHRGQYHELDQIGGKDEICTASHAMDELAAAFSHMIETEYKWKLDNTQLKLDLAYARINPHFLYNTLDAIDYYIHSGDSDVSVELIRSLAVFYRKSLNLGSDVVSVANELAHLESYLFIEQKMNDNIHITIEVPQELQDVRINAITLQPLVENSIQHGPDGSGRPLQIHVYGYEHEDQAVLVVEDDGVGFLRKTARSFNENRSHTLGGIGISNVNARIRMRFGDVYGLYVTEKDTPGAEVRIILPLRGE